MAKRILLFTDLDGTLIDFDTYSHVTAQPLVHALLAAGIELVFCSSKTYPEQAALMAELAIDVPAIVENGAGLYLPARLARLDPGDGVELPLASEGRLLRFGKSSAGIRAALVRAEQALRLDLGRYTDLGPERLSQLTGLARPAAARAIERMASETFTASLGPAELSALAAYLAGDALQFVSGGRFYTVTSEGVDKGQAVRRLSAALRRAYPEDDWHSYGVGDGANDRPMLAEVASAFLVQTSGGSWADLALPRLQLIPAPGPAGWCQLATSLLGAVSGER